MTTIRCDVCNTSFESNTPHITAGDMIYCMSCCRQRLEEYESLIQNLGNTTKEVLEDDASGDIRKDVATVCELFHLADECVMDVRVHCEEQIDSLDESDAAVPALEAILELLPDVDEGDEEEEESDTDDAGEEDKW